MAYRKMPFLVVMEDGRELEVIVDQRDLAKWEALELQDGLYTKIRWLAWSSMTRQRLTTAPWEQFNSLDCIEVGPVPGADDEEEEAEDGAERLDPGPKDQSAAT